MYLNRGFAVQKQFTKSEEVYGNNRECIKIFPCYHKRAFSQGILKKKEELRFTFQNKKSLETI